MQNPITMLTISKAFKIKSENAERELLITPLFFQDHKESWQPNEIFELLETGRLEDGVWIEHTGPIELGKIIIDDHKEWRYEGESDLQLDDIKEIVAFALS